MSNIQPKSIQRNIQEEALLLNKMYAEIKEELRVKQVTASRRSSSVGYVKRLVELIIRIITRIIIS